MKIAIICSDFHKSNIRKLPWKYVYEIVKYLNNKHEVIVITDSNKRDIDEIEIIHIKKLFKHLKGESKELLNVLEHENPDKCIMLLGLTSFLRREFNINKPVIGIFTSPIYSFKELIRNIGIKDSLKYRDYTFIHYLNSLIPNYFTRKWGEKFENIVFLSYYTKKKLIDKGFNSKKAVLIPIGIDKDFLELPELENVENIKKEINPENIPVIMYFTSPLTLRGTDTLVKAFAKVREKMPCKLVFLSRIDYDSLLKEEMILKKIGVKKKVNDSIEIISKYLSPEEIKEYLSIADVVCLPFKIVISDIPVSLLEAMALKRAVISTKVACIPEILNEKGIIVTPNNPQYLEDAIIQMINNNELRSRLIKNSKDYMEKYPNWAQIGQEFTKLI